MEGLVPRIIVTAIGAAALGAPEALRILLTFAGQSPLADIAICVSFIGMVTAHLLGVVLLARFVRKAPAQAGAGGRAAPRPRAPATDCFDKLTLVVSVGVAFLVTACLVVVPGGGLMSPVLFATVLVIGTAGSLPFVVMPLLRVLRQARNAGGAAPATRATERFARTTRPAYLTGLSLVIGIGLLLFNSFVEPGGIDALLRPFHGFTNTFVGVGAATVVGTVLVACFSLRARIAAGAGEVVPAPATVAERFSNLMQMASVLAVVCFALAVVLSVI